MRGRIDGQKQVHNSESPTTGIEFAERNTFEETCWMDESRIDRGDCQLDGGSTKTLTRSGSEEERTPRGDREIIHNGRRQDVGRRFGWSGWLSVVVTVQTWILQATSEWTRLAEWKEFGSAKCCDRPCVFESTELERSRSGGRLNGHFPVADFDDHRLGRFVTARMFQEAGWSECWCTRTIHAVRTLGGDCDAHQSSCIRDGMDKRELLEEGADRLQSSCVDS